MNAWQEREFTVNGRRISAKAWHSPDKPLLLALHGWLDNAASFDRIAPALSDYHVLAIDFPGHGLSEHLPEGVRQHFLDYVDDVHALIQQLGLERLRLMGHSMGAGVSVLLAGAFPELIERLILIEGFGPLSGEAEQAPAQLREAVLEWRAHQAGARIFADRELAVRARQAGFSPLSEQAARILCERGVKAVAGGFAWTSDKRLRLRSPLRMSEPQVLAFIRAISAPTLLIRGDSGLPFDQGQYAARLEAHGQLQMRSLPGGHHLHLDESPEAVAAEILSFLCAGGNQV